MTDMPPHPSEHRDGPLRENQSVLLLTSGHWYVCPGLLSRLSNREFEIYYDRRVRHVGAC